MDKSLVNHFTWLANKLAESYSYDTWSDSFKAKEIKDAFNTFYKSIRGNLDLDLDKLTVADLREMRFARWSDENPDLWLIPLWFVPLLPEGIELTSIFGKKVIFNGNNIDLDIRFGCIAYGIIKSADSPAPLGGEANG